MTHMYNTTVHSTINDVSVTTGNADGWVVITRDPIAAPVPTPLARRAIEPKPAARKAKRPRKARA